MLRLANISYRMTQTVPFNKFEEVLEQLQKEEKKAVALFTSDKNQDGSDWCPDCVAVKPLYETLENESKKAGLPFYIFIAGDRPTWKDPENKFRKHKLIRLSSVPTFCLFDGKKFVNKLTEAEVLDAANRKMVYEG
jgi:thiol-disulfide isomerase/thioredoxin